MTFYETYIREYYRRLKPVLADIIEGKVDRDEAMVELIEGMRDYAEQILDIRGVDSVRDELKRSVQ